MHDYAVAGLLAAAVSRNAGLLIARVPYVRYVRRTAGQWSGPEAASPVVGAPFIDATTLVGFLMGNLTWRSLVL